MGIERMRSRLHAFGHVDGSYDHPQSLQGDLRMRPLWTKLVHEPQVVEIQVVPRSSAPSPHYLPGSQRVNLLAGGQALDSSSDTELLLTTAANKTPYNERDTKLAERLS